MLYLYNAAFAQLNFGYAAAVGVILFVVIFTATVVQRRLFGRCPVVVGEGRPAAVAAGRNGPRRRRRLAPAAGGRRRWPRRLAYVVLIGYALLMFVPFAWSLITSFKTLPDSVQLTFIPDPFTFAAYDYIFTKLDPALPRLFFNSGLIAVR